MFNHFCLVALDTSVYNHMRLYTVKELRQRDVFSHHFIPQTSRTRRPPSSPSAPPALPVSFWCSSSSLVNCRRYFSSNLSSRSRCSCCRTSAFSLISDCCWCILRIPCLISGRKSRKCFLRKALAGVRILSSSSSLLSDSRGIGSPLGSILAGEGDMKLAQMLNYIVWWEVEGVLFTWRTTVAISSSSVFLNHVSHVTLIGVRHWYSHPRLGQLQRWENRTVGAAVVSPVALQLLPQFLSRSRSGLIFLLFALLRLVSRRLLLFVR